MSDLGAGQGDLGDVNTGDFDLVLDIVGSDVGDAVQKGDTSHLLLTQEVADLNDVLAVVLDAGHVDRKVGIAEAHLVLEALGDTNDHVLDVRADGSLKNRKENK